MARLPRCVVAGLPLHITHRGVDRMPTFLAEADYRRFRDVVRDAAQSTGCAIHAYVLMTNHVHFLLTPENVDGPARLVEALGRRYVRYFNRKHGRTGTLWEGRFRSTLVDSERYFLACSRYIELNPVRAGMVSDPIEYAWSSYSANASGDPDALVTPHRQYLALGSLESDRRAAYRALFRDALDSATMDAIRLATRRGEPLVDAQLMGRTPQKHGQGLPRLPHGGDRKSKNFRRNSNVLAP